MIYSVVEIDHYMYKMFVNYFFLFNFCLHAFQITPFTRALYDFKLFKPI